MPAFKYKAVSRSGAPVSGVIEAYDEFEAVARIRESCPIVTQIAEARQKQSLLTREIGQPKLKDKPLALLCSQFAIILKAGLPLSRAVQLIGGQTGDRRLRRLLDSVAGDVDAGYGLAQSFENKGAGYLPPTFIETVRAGEGSGTLERAFDKLFRYYEKAAKVKSQVRSAMMYPVFLLALAVCVVAFIMTAVMPIFVDMFASLGTELPGLTRFLMAVSDFFAANGLAVLAAVVLLCLGLKLWSGTEGGRLRLARLRLRLPALGRVARMKGASQTANTLSTLLTAGMPLMEAVASTARTLDNYHLQLELAAVLPGLEEGRRLADCLRDRGCFPELLVEMAAVGEETGSLEETFATVGDYYDSEVEAATKRALGLLQPAITVVLGIVIGVIVIALYLPMFSMYGGIA